VIDLTKKVSLQALVVSFNLEWDDGAMRTSPLLACRVSGIVMATPFGAETKHYSIDLILPGEF
jgi:hypothetical protein